jgi:amino acid transporter
MSKNNSIQTTLGRDLGFYTALAIGVGTMIAAGIFTLSGLAIRNVGSGAIVSFLLAAGVSLFTALTYCEFVSIYPQSGEGYLYARKTYSAPVAFIVGWALFLGYISSCSFYISSLSAYFVEFILATPIESISGVVCLIGLTFLNIKGSKESGKFQVIVTVAKVILLLWFVIGGFQYISASQLVEEFNSNIVDLVQTSAFVFITFFGFSAIAASAGEVKNPTKNIPKAIFWSMGIVTVLYIMVVTVIIAANLSEYTEAAMGKAATLFLGGVGGLVIVGGGIFSMISASNASIMAGSRVALAMSNLGHLPKEIGIVNSKTRTPIMALFFVSGLILVFVLSLELEDLAHFADTVLLFALIMVNLALILHRKKYPDIKRPFKVPLVPLLPIIGIIANGYLLSQMIHHILPVGLALGAIALGFIGFLSWKGAQAGADAVPGVPSKLAFETHPADENEKPQRILVPVANPHSLPKLIQLASQLAKEKNAVLILLRVMTVPPLMPIDYDFEQTAEEEAFLRMAQKEASQYKVSVSSVLRIGYDTAKAILETAKEKHCQLIVLGWKGYSSTTDKILGRTMDQVVTYAKRDIMLIKLSQKHETFNRILLPTAGGPHAKAAENYAALLTKAMNGKLTICRVVPGHKVGIKELEEHKQKIHEAKERIIAYNGVVPEIKILRSDSIVKVIKQESKKHDTVMVGATRDSAYQQILFGSIPEDLAKILKTNMIVIKHYKPIAALWGKVISEEA